MKSAMPPSGVPAFIATAPPTVAGTPTRHSMPPRLSAAASRIRAERLTPAPATASSPLNSARPRQPSSLSTTPRTPRSLTSRLLPPPMTSIESCSRSAKDSAKRMSSTSWGTMKMSAGPPIRKEVWKLSGSLNRTSPRISPSMRLSPFRRVGTVAEPLEQFPAQLAHVAGPESEHEITCSGGFAQVVDDGRPVAAQIEHLPVPVGRDAVGQVAGVHAGNRRLARGVDVHDDEDVGLVERGQEIVPQVLRPRVAVWLEHRDHAPVEPRLGGGEGRADLGGVMAVVVDDEHVAGGAPDLEAPLHPREAGQGGPDLRKRHLEVERDRGGGQRVEHVVAAGNL